MTDECISYEVRDGVAYIGIDRENKRNALRQSMFEAIGSHVRDAESRARVGVIFSHGENFSAGLDLAENSERTPLDTFADSKRQGAIMDSIDRGRIPWISALTGATIGAGFELAASTHLRVADETTYFVLPEGRRGIFVGGGGSVRISRLIGVARMIDMMLTARVLTTDEARNIGVVQYTVPSGQALTKATDLAEQIADNSPVANEMIVSSLNRIRDMNYTDGLFVESALAALVQSSPGAAEGVNQFLTKQARPLRS